VQEETGLSVRVEELLHVGELLSAGSHALDTLFYCQLEGTKKDVTEPGDASLLEITWLSLDRLDSVRLEPREFWDVFRRDPWLELDRLPASPQYVGRYERRTARPGTAATRPSGADREDVAVSHRT